MLLEKTRKEQTQNPLKSGGGMGGRRARVLEVNQPTLIPRKTVEEISKVPVTIQKIKKKLITVNVDLSRTNHAKKSNLILQWVSGSVDREVVIDNIS